MNFWDNITEFVTNFSIEHPILFTIINIGGKIILGIALIILAFLIAFFIIITIFDFIKKTVRHYQLVHAPFMKYYKTLIQQLIQMKKEYIASEHPDLTEAEQKEYVRGLENVILMLEYSHDGSLKKYRDGYIDGEIQKRI